MIVISPPAKNYQAPQLLDDLGGGLTSGQVYKAMTDGIVNAWGTSGASTGFINSFVGATSNPTTGMGISGWTTGQGSFFVSFPVKKDYFWKITLTGISPTLTDLVWTPDGPGIATPEKQ